MGRCYGEPVGWSYCTSTFDGVTPAVDSSGNPPGVNFTAKANDGTGTDVTVLAALAHDVHRIVFAVGGISGSAIIGTGLGDLRVDPAGGTAWSTIWSDIICGHTQVGTGGAAQALGHRYEINLFLKAGTSIGFRAKTHHTSDIATGRIAMHCFGDPSNPDQWWCCEKVETLGAGVNSQGTLITPGNTGTFGSWTSVGGTTTYRYGAIMLGVQSDTNNAMADAGYQVQIGRGSVKLPGTPDIYFSTNSSEQARRAGGMAGEFLGCEIAAGTQLQARATQSGSNSLKVGTCIYGAVR